MRVILSFLLLSMASLNAYCSVKLSDFEHVRAALLNGDNVAYIVNLKQCDLIKDNHDDNAPKRVENTFGDALNHRFILKSATGAINFGHESINAPDNDRPLPPNYTTADFMAYPDGKVAVELKMASLLTSKLMIETMYYCYLSPNEDRGIKFFKVN